MGVSSWMSICGNIVSIVPCLWQSLDILLSKISHGLMSLGLILSKASSKLGCVKEIDLSSLFGSKSSLDPNHKALSLSVHSLAMTYEFLIHSSQLLIHSSHCICSSWSSLWSLWLLCFGCLSGFLGSSWDLEKEHKRDHQCHTRFSKEYHALTICVPRMSTQHI
jgi:hypothetical protein